MVEVLGYDCLYRLHTYSASSRLNRLISVASLFHESSPLSAGQQMSFWKTDHGEDAISRIRRRAILVACTRNKINASASAAGHLITSLYDSF